MSAPHSSLLLTASHYSTLTMPSLSEEQGVGGSSGGEEQEGGAGGRSILGHGAVGYQSVGMRDLGWTC
jgi:hypothetical protein